MTYFDGVDGEASKTMISGQDASLIDGLGFTRSTKTAVFNRFEQRLDLTSAVNARLERKSFQLGLKRLGDFVGALVLLVVLSPLLLAVALAVKLTSRGPVFFAQKRWGKDNRPFTVYKFRSMYADRCDVTGVQHTVANDDRVTPLGRFLRKTSIDELPQLLNVLVGDMSLVGPRAHVLGMKAVGRRYEDLVPEYFARHAVRPGLTGLAQVRGLRGEVADVGHARGRIESDLEYIARYSLWLDIKIAALTIPAVLTGKAAG